MVFLPEREKTNKIHRRALTSLSQSSQVTAVKIRAITSRSHPLLAQQASSLHLACWLDLVTNDVATLMSRESSILGLADSHSFDRNKVRECFLRFEMETLLSVFDFVSMDKLTDPSYTRAQGYSSSFMLRLTSISTCGGIQSQTSVKNSPMMPLIFPGRSIKVWKLSDTQNMGTTSVVKSGGNLDNLTSPPLVEYPMRKGKDIIGGIG
ncbi:hypothetical protein Bca52824_024584 [Brassica carinata]|uniref:Uncharacterized protein n=1 Tax=Brassica carinata TaxID=52824 RepID=A0A8X8AVU1_BRACI|nr:hypothetical protein Bca52824_024584 [Brassica carinata]